MKKRTIVLFIGASAFLVFVICLTLLLGNQLQPQTCGCPHVISHNFIWLFIILAVIFVGSLIYYLLSLKISAKEGIINKNIEILHTILDSEEEKVLNKLGANKGEIEQSKISQMFDKIKAHRVIKKLKQKGIIEISKSGKKNKIKLNKELKKEFVK